RPLYQGPLVDQLERKLNLPRIARRPADLAEPLASHDVGRHPHGDNVEQVEELGAELHIHAFGSALAPPEGRVFDEGEVVVVERWPAECIAAERAEAPLVGSGAAGHVNRNGEERAIVRAAAEIILANLARGGEVRLRNLVGPIDAVRAVSRLLHAGEYREWRAGAHAADAEQFPSVGDFAVDGMQELRAFQMHVLRNAERKRIRGIEVRWTFLRMRVVGILREA